MSSGSGLPPKAHAAFAVLSRLVSCVVTEGVLPSRYLPFVGNSQHGGVLVVLSAVQPSDSFVAADILLLVPLRHSPVLKSSNLQNVPGVALVDPLDMEPEMYEIAEQDDAPCEHGDFCDMITDVLLPFRDFDKGLALRRVVNPLNVWASFQKILQIPSKTEQCIALELQSSLDWQSLAYENLPKCPSLLSEPIEWEQSLVAGHPTHPMHRARSLETHPFGYDWYRPLLRFARVPRNSVSVHGNFPLLAYRLASSAAQANGQSLSYEDDFVWMPVHELQVPNIRSKCPGIEVLPKEINLRAYAQSSIRTVSVPELEGYSIKLAVGVRISSALRTISHFTADFGPRFSTEVVPKLEYDPEILAIELETSSAVYHSDDPDVAKHLTVILREECPRAKGEVPIVVASLLESDLAGMPPGVPVFQHVFGLNTESKRIDFLDRYIRIACAALLPALLKNGVAFEAHAQNMLARFDIQTGELKGFVYRDLGGMRIHPPTLNESTGADFKFLPHHASRPSTLEEIYPKFYHTFVHNHIQRLIRVLDLHYNGKGWELLRRHMHDQIPKGHPVFKLWLDPTSLEVQSKGLLRMRMQDSYRDMVYCAYPNMIQYRPSEGALTPASPSRSLPAIIEY